MSKISVHPVAEENPGFLLWQVSTLWSRCTSAALKPLGITHPQFIILATIDWLAGKGGSQEEIGRRVVLDPKVTSHLLRSLEVKGLVQPSHSEMNKAPVLTAAGAKMLAKALPLVESSDGDFFASIDLKNSEMVSSLQMLARVNLGKTDGESCSCE
jgi:MarR family transcriptional regulator, organic hydroperoxide resistance regulator